MSTLILVRHGQSIYNQENRFTGNLDIGLTEIGKDEARLAGQKLTDFKFDIAYTSTLKRATESLKIILKEINQTNIKIIQNQALNERCYGDLQGLNKTETATKFGLKQLQLWRRSYDVRPPNGESLKDTFKRTIPYYQLVIEPQLKLEKCVLIVAHGNSLRALMMYLENINQQNIVNLNIPTGVPKEYILDKDLKIIESTYL